MKQDNQDIGCGGGKIPEGEKWVYENSQALAAILKGLDDSAKGKVTERNINQK